MVPLSFFYLWEYHSDLCICNTYITSCLLVSSCLCFITCYLFIYFKISLYCLSCLKPLISSDPAASAFWIASTESHALTTMRIIVVVRRVLYVLHNNLHISRKLSLAHVQNPFCKWVDASRSRYAILAATILLTLDDKSCSFF